MPDAVGLVRDVYAGFARGDLSTLDAHLASGALYVNPDEAIESGVRKGAESFRQAVRGVMELFDYEVVDASRVVEIGDQVVVEYHARGVGRGSGAPIDTTFGHIWTIRDGVIHRLEWYMTYDQALEAAQGAAEQASRPADHA